jgi:hypothetical protein
MPYYKHDIDWLKTPNRTSENLTQSPEPNGIGAFSRLAALLQHEPS